DMEIAKRFASVPELAKRTSSIEWKRLQIRRASSSSWRICPPMTQPLSRASRTARRNAGCECPWSPAVYSPRKSTYSRPSREVSLAPFASTSVIGKGSLKSDVRVLPPGSTSAALRCCCSLRGFASTKRARAASRAAATAWFWVSVSICLLPSGSADLDVECLVEMLATLGPRRRLGAQEARNGHQQRLDHVHLRQGRVEVEGLLDGEREPAVGLRIDRRAGVGDGRHRPPRVAHHLDQVHDGAGVRAERDRHQEVLRPEGGGFARQGGARYAHDPDLVAQDLEIAAEKVAQRIGARPQGEHVHPPRGEQAPGGLLDLGVVERMRDREHLAALGFRQALRGTGALLAGALRDQLADAGAVEGLRLAHMPPEHILQFTETAEAEPLAQPGERGRVHAVVG